MRLSEHTGSGVRFCGTTGRKVLVISGSPSEHSRSARLGAYIEADLADRGCATTTLRLRDLPAEALMFADTKNTDIAAAMASVAQADGVVLATPIYKAAYSGLLKAFLDILPQFGLGGKAVLPVATGGSTAHVLSLDYALRPVIQSMGARHVVQGCFVIDRHVGSSGAMVTIDPEYLPFLTSVIGEFANALSVEVCPPVAA